MALYETLQEMGFTPVVTPITKFEEFKNRFYSKPKYVPKECDFFLRKTINGKVYEVYIIDYWYVEMRIGGRDGEVVFSKRRFEDEELLRLIPID